MLSRKYCCCTRDGERVSNLYTSLTEQRKEDAARAIRELVREIVLLPDANGQLTIDLKGELAEMLSFAVERTKKIALPEPALINSAISQESVVAGACNHLDLQLEKLLSTVL